MNQRRVHGWDAEEIPANVQVEIERKAGVDERALDRGTEHSDTLQQLLTASEELLEIWRTWLGPNRESCDEGGKRIWDRIDAIKPAERDGNDA